MSREDNLRRIAEIAAGITGGSLEGAKVRMAEYEKMLGIARPVVKCTHCLAKNRIDPSRDEPKCGECGFPLPT